MVDVTFELTAFKVGHSHDRTSFDWFIYGEPDGDGLNSGYTDRYI